ncbi:hypothetical protein FSS13T_26100 [Flavobacterium saliperosum S13]|uniref:Uncharacterized protein n=1 Tax=Flavobacterium saliperosum S13 TaxID=1341155 RepID=A0ABP3A006_9FLAO|nr:hypothetical protein FSS13T_26100 [Flavobacterium saliperosum S13]
MIGPPVPIFGAITSYALNLSAAGKWAFTVVVRVVFHIL